MLFNDLVASRCATQLHHAPSWSGGDLFLDLACFALFANRLSPIEAVGSLA